MQVFVSVRLTYPKLSILLVFLFQSYAYMSTSSKLQKNTGLYLIRIPVGIPTKLNIYRTYTGRSGHMNVLCSFNLAGVSTVLLLHVG